MTGFVRARIDYNLKNDAAAVLDSLGLTVSDAIRMLLTRIAKEKALPVELVTPNATTIAAIEEAREIARQGKQRFKDAEAMFSELEAGKDET